MLVLLSWGWGNASFGGVLQANKKIKKMSALKTILKWFFGISFVLSGLMSIADSPIVAILLIVLGLFLVPPTLKIIEQKLNYSFPTPARWAIAIGGLFLVGFIVSSQTAAEDKKVDKIVEEASILIDKGEIATAKEKIEDAKSKYSTSDNKAIKLEDEIEKSQSLDFAKEQLVGLTDDEFTKLQEGDFEKSILTQKTLNVELINLMKEQASEREKLIKEIEEKREQERIATELEAKRKKEEELNKNRKETIEKQFSAWDGSHPALTRLIKENMNDPDSYDHIETKFRDDGNSIFVITKFRGANAFGGKVINTISARVDFEGNVIEIVSQN